MWEGDRCKKLFLGDAGRGKQYFCVGPGVVLIENQKTLFVHSRLLEPRDLTLFYEHICLSGDPILAKFDHTKFPSLAPPSPFPHFSSFFLNTLAMSLVSPPAKTADLDSATSEASVPIFIPSEY
jgi:hypothetical protein